MYEVLETRAASPNAPPVIHELANALPVDFTPSIKVANECFKSAPGKREIH